MSISTGNNVQRQNDKVLVIDKPEPILVTKKVVKFGSYVYQFRNVTGFGFAKVKTPYKVHPLVILILLILGAILVKQSDQTLQQSGIAISVLGCAGVIDNLMQPKRIGLELYVNSGDNVIFVTADKSGVRDVISQLCEFMESDTEDIKVININQTHATIGVGYAEQLQSGQIGGKIDNRQQ
ncbi:MAG: hypothetical protein JGK04_09605 [Microcoleus sp. PH2017_39_LGB_O_B]|uniref:DUF6232 family protein n=1 Tax=unclassified Microcoleus TaxID=2642155 RepID=UPI001D3D3EBA|nr:MULTISPECIES: DUF6232 family protein [unclassified Microcoleus]TAF89655.1 MAG: hypothetical protein EAZ49_12125 [Oscillatoriales cyanobacterium]MCC3447809.1 hypothetical protein [Microcoleus sp. PH2017_09_SFU_O_A]MCC3565174.1 hypothetical protein [Microcoleus sp. PH2017_31_RDM_U_A]MCC3577467.1 hypothetical protein [Microcoleus sp. PH2017_32_RDM_D_A]MCC3615497.1 hypothetical protein [Microcoleus sp. PH2017_38_RDM_U_B]